MAIKDTSELPWSQWHPTRNGDLEPNGISDGSNKRVWWLCELGHEWQTTPYYRVAKGSKCPYCIGQKLLKGFNDLATKFPDVAKEWHPTKNSLLKPDEISGGSEKKIWWVCQLGHEWQASPSNRTRVGSGCAVCAGKKVWPGFNDLASQFPRIAAEWSNRNEVSAEEVIAGSGKKVWWECPNGHEWEQKPVVRTKLGTNCPICSNQKIVAGVNDLESREPEIAQEWHPTKNGNLIPSQVSVGSNKKAWWLCSRGHTWEAAISSRRRNACPVCANFLVVLGINDLGTTHPEIATQWHPIKNGGLLPSQVALGQTKAIWWQCGEGHEWRATLDTRSRSGCPRCARFGFDQGAASELYFIENHELRAWKIGITGEARTYDRLSAYEKKGWRVIHRITGHMGYVVKQAELELFRWIRGDLQLPQFLDKASMGRHGGASETFAIIDDLREEIVKRMETEIERASNQDNPRNAPKTLDE